MKKKAAYVFHDIEWSTETVREKTLKKIHEAQKSVAFLPELMDVDTAEDWAVVSSR